MQEPNITDLIKQCKEYNENAFRKLVERYQAMVFSFTFRMLCDEEEAKDAVQEVFIKVWKNMDKYNPELKFTTWLFSIASNHCCDKLRFRKRRIELNSIETVNIFISDENIETTVINSDLAKTIRILTDKMTPKQKLIFTLRDLEGLDVDEVQLITDMTAEKIKSNLYLARQFVKDQLEKM